MALSMGILLYIDPGTGSMLFAMFIGIVSTVIYCLRGIFITFKFRLTGGTKMEHDKNKLPLVIYSDHKRYWSIFEPVCDELDRRGQKVVYMTQSPDDPGLSKGYKHIEGRFIGEGNKGLAKMNLLNASMVLSTTPGLDVLQWKRSKQVEYYVHMFHGASGGATYHMFGLDHYDAVLLSGEHQEHQIRKLEQLRGYPVKEVYYIGIPYMDVMKKRYEALKHVQGEKKTILLAPSWGENGILTKYGSSLIDELLKTDYEIVIRPHPQSFTAEKEMIEGLQRKYPDVKWNRDSDNFDILSRSDLLISDFSGVIMEYAMVFERPVLYTSIEFDDSKYDCAWMDGEVWLLKNIPNLGMELKKEDIPNVGEMIETALSSRQVRERLDKVIKETWMYRGEGTQRAADYIMDKLKSLEEIS